jgi:hypothetical protein
MSHTIDTLKIYERLRKTELPDAAAKEIAEVLKEAAEFGYEILATKEDLKRAEMALKEDLKRTELALKEDLKRTELALRKDLETGMAQTEAKIIKWVAGMLVAQAAVVATLLKLL